MKKRILYIFILLHGLCGYTQESKILVRGHIKDYANEAVYVYRAHGDTLCLVDTLRTDGEGRFTISSKKSILTMLRMTSFQEPQATGLYKVSLKNNQWFYVLCDGKLVEVKTIYHENARVNIAMDSLQVIQSAENKLFYKFQELQQQLNVADYFLKQVMRLYPLTDPFHGTIEQEYAKRYAGMDAFIKKQEMSKESMALKIAKAYYQPVVPDWKQPDYWRDSILAVHYFDYFNPSDSFYIRSIILPEKIEEYLKLKTNHANAYAQVTKSEQLQSMAAIEFLSHSKSSRINFEFSFNYVLKKFKKEHLDNAFLEVYDAFSKPQAGDCGQTQSAAFTQWLDKVNVLRKVQIGNVAPDFELEKDRLWLSGIESKYTLLIFWATWCPHCTETIPVVKELISEYKQKNSAKEGSGFTTVAVSLDNESEPWQAYVKEKNLYQFLNFSELKGWKSEVAKKYNVYATPTMILLDKNKKILAKPETVHQLKELLSTLN